MTIHHNGTAKQLAVRLPKPMIEQLDKITALKKSNKQGNFYAEQFTRSKTIRDCLRVGMSHVLADLTIKRAPRKTKTTRRKKPVKNR